MFIELLPRNSVSSLWRKSLGCRSGEPKARDDQDQIIALSSSESNLITPAMVQSIGRVDQVITTEGQSRPQDNITPNPRPQKNKVRVAGKSATNDSWSRESTPFGDSATNLTLLKSMRVVVGGREFQHSWELSSGSFEQQSLSFPSLRINTKLPKTKMGRNIYHSPYPTPSVPTDLSVSQFLLRSDPDDTHPDVIVLADFDAPEERFVTYGGIRQNASRDAATLRNTYGLHQNDVVCIYGVNSVYWASLAHATLWAGGCFWYVQASCGPNVC
jgi:hypothetical protein